eukprot:767903-Hanusia_phi.AAC.13
MRTKHERERRGAWKGGERGRIEGGKKTQEGRGRGGEEGEKGEEGEEEEEGEKGRGEDRRA